MLKFEIPQEHLTAAIEGLEELAQRLEIDAAAYARLGSEAARALAVETLERAAAIRRSADFYINL